MPELPEVETVRAQLDARLRGATITRVEMVKTGREEPRGPRFAAVMTGQSIERIDRRAKLLVWRFASGSSAIAHLKMTGRFVFVRDGDAAGKHDRIMFSFSNGERLVWSDVRQFGFMRHVDAVELQRVLSAYGPEPLDVAPEALADRLSRRSSRSVKAALLDQGLIAGIGNIYADEALHRAKVRPSRRLQRLMAAERFVLAHEIQNVLRESIAQRGTSANDYVDTRGERGGFLGLLRVYGHAGEPCRTCATPIKKIVVAQRGTHYCPTCQV